MSFPYRLTPTSINILLNGTTYTITQDSHQYYDRIRAALKDKDYETVQDLIDLPKAVNTFGEGLVKVVDGIVMFGEYAIHNTLTKRIIEQMEEGFDVKPMIKFLENLMQNPAKRAVDELFDFLEATSLPITEDGHFVAYKKVRTDYKDIYTGTISNAVGQVVKMPRNMVDEEKSRTCSAGLHFCSESYLPHYGAMDISQARVVLVKINPADVVAIPADYDNAKGRACRYEVIGEADFKDLKFYSRSVFTTEDISDINDDDSDEDDYSGYTVEKQVHLGGRFIEVGNWDDIEDAKDEANEILDDGGVYRVTIRNVSGDLVFDEYGASQVDELEEIDLEDNSVAVATPVPMVDAPSIGSQPLFTKSQVAAILFGDGSKLNEVDLAVQLGKIALVNRGDTALYCITP